MTDEEKPILDHFATCRFKDGFWRLGPGDRAARALACFEGIRSVTDVAHLYLTQGIEFESDVLEWSTATVGGPDLPAEFFRDRAAADNVGRDVMEQVHVLWGMTRPSEYSRAAKSAQEIDSFAEERTPYLVMYPFTKTADWYLLGRERRQADTPPHAAVLVSAEDWSSSLAEGA